MSGEGTYAPKSPDLSSFFSSDPTQEAATGQPSPAHPEPYQRAPSQDTFLHQQQHPTNYYSHPVAARPPSQPQPPLPLAHAQPQLLQPHNSTAPAYSQLPPNTPHHQYPQSVTPAGPQPVGQAFQAQGQAQSPGRYGLQPPTAYPNYYQPYGDGQYQPALTTQPFSPQQFYGTSASLGQIPSHLDSQSQGGPAQLQPQPQSRSQSQIHIQPQPQPHPDNMPPRRSAAASSSQQPPVIEPSPVKTKFPTARIKRIMQADEEVGKVAQQTPIAVGKALEMFMIHIVTKSAEVAKEKNSKRVTAAMLKQVVESDEQWDFLRDIVSKVDVEDKAGKAGGKPKAESESEEEPVEKKKGKGGRKKKA